MTLTEHQRAIIDSIVKEFKTINSKKAHYIDVTPMLDKKSLIRKEKAEAEGIFLDKLKAFIPFVEENFRILIDDLSKIDWLKFEINYTFQNVVLKIGSTLAIRCTIYGKYNLLSDGQTTAANDINPVYYLVYNDGAVRKYDCFKDTIESTHFKNEIEKIINNGK